MEDDVLSLSIHGESIDDSSSRATDVSDMMVIDEVGYDKDSPKSSDNREVKDDGVFQQYLNRREDEGAFGPSSDHQAGTGLDQQEQILEHHEDEGALDLPLEHQEIRLNECFVCRKVIRTKVKRHVLKQHLPWFWAPHTHVGNARFRKPNLDRWHRDIL
jgi:hypothetical protein